MVARVTPMRLAASETVGEEARKGIAASWFDVRSAGISVSFCRILSLFVAKGCAGPVGRWDWVHGPEHKKGTARAGPSLCYNSTYVRWLSRWAN